MCYYDWNRDIDSVSNDESDEMWEVRYLAGKKIALGNGPECYGFEDWDEDTLHETACTEGADIIGFYRIKQHGALHVLLQRFLTRQGKEIEETVRDVVFEDGWMYFVTGCGYDVLDRDLLGGNGDGLTRAAFDKYVAEVFKM